MMKMMKMPVAVVADGFLRSTAKTTRMIGGGWNLQRQYRAAITTTTTRSLVNGTISQLCHSMNFSCEKLQLFGSQQRRSMASSIDNNNTTNEEGVTSAESFTGIVKFWNRRKKFGFISARIGRLPEKDYFVGVGSVIVLKPKEIEQEGGQEEVKDTDTSSDNVSDDSGSDKIITPNIYKGERVRFRVRTLSNGTQKAVDVTWLDGKAISPIRNNFLDMTHKHVKAVMGEKIFEIVKNINTSDDPEGLLQQIQIVYNDATGKISEAERKIIALGMKVEEFPLYPFSREGVVVRQCDDDSNKGDDE